MKELKEVFPRVKKSISDFLQDDEGTTLRTKAAVIGPAAVAAVVLMNRELVTASASRYVSHASHRSHSSHSSNSTNRINEATKTNTVQHATHGSHSSGNASGFSHKADTYDLEVRNKE